MVLERRLVWEKSFDKIYNSNCFCFFMPLIKTQILEIQEHLDKAQNPLFLFDNDQDGLCSFLLLQRFCEKGKGFPVKNARSSGKDYLRKINEFDSDYVFILDVPEFSAEFLEEIEKFNIPVVWIDHHEVSRDVIPNFVNYFNPFFNSESSNEPVTALCWDVVKNSRKQDSWLGIAGCISDKFVPDFYNDFRKDYPEIALENFDDAFDIFYGSEIGKVARIMGFGLKDKTTNVIQMMKFLMKAKSPHDVLNESKENKSFHKRFVEIEEKYQTLMARAKKGVSKEDKFIFFKYAGGISMSSEIANGLKYFFPDKYVFVAYSKGARINLSGRGDNVRGIVLDIIDKIEGATGGGHENAVGAQIGKDDLDFFENEIKNNFR